MLYIIKYNRNWSCVPFLKHDTRFALFINCDKSVICYV